MEKWEKKALKCFVKEAFQCALATAVCVVSLVLYAAAAFGAAVHLAKIFGWSI